MSGNYLDLLNQYPSTTIIYKYNESFDDISTTVTCDTGLLSTKDDIKKNKLEKDRIMLMALSRESHYKELFKKKVSKYKEHTLIVNRDKLITTSVTSEITIIDMKELNKQ
jgi:hypothetical protein